MVSHKVDILGHLSGRRISFCLGGTKRKGPSLMQRRTNFRSRRIQGHWLPFFFPLCFAEVSQLSPEISLEPVFHIGPFHSIHSKKVAIFIVFAVASRSDEVNLSACTSQCAKSMLPDRKAYLLRSTGSCITRSVDVYVHRGITLGSLTFKDQRWFDIPGVKSARIKVGRGTTLLS